MSLRLQVPRERRENQLYGRFWRKWKIPLASWPGGLMVTPSNMDGMVTGVFRKLVPGQEPVASISQGPDSIMARWLPGTRSEQRDPEALNVPEGVRTFQTCSAKGDGDWVKGGVREVSEMMDHRISWLHFSYMGVCFCKTHQIALMFCAFT